MGLFLAVFGAFNTWWFFRTFVWEDAYITYRYAQNLSLGRGFVFNPGEWVLGTTTPLYALVLGTFGKLGLAAPEVSGVLFCASLGAAGFLGTLIALNEDCPRAALLFPALLGTGFGNLRHFFGMETPFLLALLLLAFWLQTRRKSFSAGVIAGLAMLTRYDAVIFVGLLLAWELRVHGSRNRALDKCLADRPARTPTSWRFAAGASLVFLPWAAFALFRFGSLMPSTLAAKSSEVGFVPYLLRSAILYTDGVGPLRWFGLTASREGYLGPIAFVGLLLGLLGLRKRFRGYDPPTMLLAVSAVTTWLAYAVIGPPVEHRWHLVPSLLLLLLAGLIGADRLLPKGRGGTLAIAALLIAVVAAQPFGARAEFLKLTDTGLYKGRIHSYQEQARFLTDQSLTGLTVLTVEPGYLAFLTDAFMIDAAGLITPGVKADFNNLVLDFAPDLVVVNPNYPIGESMPGYVTVHTTRQGRGLQMRVDAFEQWTETARRSPNLEQQPSSLKHPFSLEPGRDVWNNLGGSLSELTREGESYLKSPKAAWPYQSFVSPSFAIDFDELGFEVSVGDQLRTSMSLLVDGQVALRHTGPSPGVHLETLYWSVKPWKGREGRLLFVDQSNDAEIRVGQIWSIRNSQEALLHAVNNFASDGFWTDSPKGFAVVDATTLEPSMRLRLGERKVLLASAAGTLRSKPFVLTGLALSTHVLDIKGNGGHLRVVIGEEVIHEFKGKGDGQLNSVIWTVQDHRGESAVLELALENEDTLFGMTDVWQFNVL